jgi:hypothetical protein
MTRTSDRYTGTITNNDVGIGMREELMEERLPEDEERCEDAPESIYQFSSGCYSVIVLKTLGRAAWFLDAVRSEAPPVP